MAVSDSFFLGIDATPLRPGRTGVGTYTENLIGSLQETDAFDRIVLFSNRPAELDRSGAARRQVHEGDVFPVRAVWMQTILPRVLRKVRPALCHFPNYLAPLSCPCPRVVTFHDMSLFRYPRFYGWKKRHLSRALLAQVARRAEAVITVSESSRSEIVRILGIHARKVHAIHEAPSPAFHPVTDTDVHEDVRSRYGLPESFVLHVGTLEPRKNIARLLSAFEGLSRHHPILRDVRLVLAGARGWKSGPLADRMRRLEEKGRLLELGYVPQGDLPPLYSMARLVAYPSLYEGFGLPIVEGMACGTPVLTSDRSSMAEVAGTAAVLVDPEDVGDIRKGIERVLTSPGLAGELAERGKSRAAEFSWRRAAGETLDVYRRVLDSSGGRSPLWREDPHPSTPVASPGPEDLGRSILRTLIYADLFHFPLTLGELHRGLMGQRADREEVEERLRGDPRLRDRTTRCDGHLCLKGREGLVERRRSQEAATDRLIAGNLVLLRVLSRIPFLRMIAFSGGTSHKNSPACHDLDLFLVAAPGRIWTVHALFVLISRLFRRRRVACANYIVDTTHLRLPGGADLFKGHELLSIKPLTGERWARALVEANAWALELYPNAPMPCPEELWQERRWEKWIQRGIEKALWPFRGLFEWAARRLFGRRIRRQAKASRSAGVILDDGILKLHVRDRRAPVVERFRGRLQEEGLWDRRMEALLGSFETRAAHPPVSTQAISTACGPASVNKPE